MPRNYIVIAATVVAILLLAFFLWPQTPGEITEPAPPAPVEDPGTAD